MTDFHFASPNFLFLLPALLVLMLALGRIDRGARDKLLKFLHATNLERLLQSKGTVRDRGKKAAFWLGLALMTLALARPQANPTVEEMQSSGLDIYVLLDVSRSMDSEDVAPSRLKKAKRTIQHLAARLSGDRVGIIAFANSAVLVSPLTNDYSILDTYLQNIDTSVVPSQGTNFANALETAKEAMERGAKNTTQTAAHTNIFLLLSDGEDHADTDLSVVDEIKKQGGLVFAIAFGTEKGAPIPMRDENGVLRGYKTDSANNVVVTKVETKTLTEIAQRGGGQFYHSTQDEGEVEDILARVNDAQRGSYTTIKTTIWEEYFWVFLAPGIFLALLSFISLRAVAPALSRLKERLTRLRPGAAAVLLVLLLPPRAHAGPISFFWNKERKASEQANALAKEKKFSDAADSLKSLQAENPDSPEINYDIGTYLLADKKGQLGREQLSHLRNAEGPLRDLALFNTAGSYAVEGKKPEARATYAELLARLHQKSKLTSDEQKLLEETKRNVARLADPNQQPQPQPDQSQQQKQDQKDQKDQKEGGGDSQKQNQGGQGNDPNDQKNQNKGDSKDDNKGGNQKDDKQKGQGGGDQKKDEKKGDQGKDQEKKDQDKGQGDQEKKDQGKGEGDKDKQPDQKQGDDNQGQGARNQDQMPRRGGQPFKERDDMGESEAKRILGALKERESDLQKKLLKNQVKGGRVKVDDAGKDW